MEELPPPGSSKAAAAGRAPRVVGVLAGLLERAAERGDAATPTPAGSAFRGRALPGIPVRRYAERIYRYAGCSPACFVVAYVYLDRLARGRDADEEDGEEGAEAVVGVDSYTVHRLLITSVLVAAKFMDDRGPVAARPDADGISLLLGTTGPIWTRGGGGRRQRREVLQVRIGAEGAERDGDPMLTYEEAAVAFVLQVIHADDDTLLLGRGEDTHVQL